MIDISALNQFISIATSATVAGDDRITLTKNAQTNTATLGSVTTNVFSRLMERTFRTANTQENYRDIRQQLVNVLTSLFDIDNPSQLPLSVRKAFVSGEIVCGKPLTKRRLDAVLAATQQALGFDRGVAGLKELQKVAAMRATIEKVVAPAKTSSEEVPEVNRGTQYLAPNGEWRVEDNEDPFYLEDFDDELFEQYVADVKDGKIELEGDFTLEELKTFFKENYKKDLGYFKTQTAAESKREEIHKITEEYKSDAKRAESADALIKHSAYEGTISTITKFLDFEYPEFDKENNNILANVMKDAIRSNENILRSERSTPAEKKQALEFFAKLKAPKFAVVFDQASHKNKVNVMQQELVNLIKSFDDQRVKITYTEKMKEIKNGIDKYIDGKINIINNKINDIGTKIKALSDDKTKTSPNAKKALEDTRKELESSCKELNDTRKKMHSISMNLFPFGKAMADIMGAVDTFAKHLEDLAKKMPHYASEDTAIIGTFDELLGNVDNNIQDEV